VEKINQEIYEIITKANIQKSEAIKAIGNNNLNMKLQQIMFNAGRFTGLVDGLEIAKGIVSQRIVAEQEGGDLKLRLEGEDIQI
jgi:hypothetical protein